MRGIATWSSAEELKQGMFLRMSAGTYAQVQGIRKWTAHQRVHNLTVADFHTYYVLAGAASVLVHNTSPSWIPGPRELTAVWLSPNDPRRQLSVPLRQTTPSRSTRRRHNIKLTPRRGSHPSRPPSGDTTKSLWSWPTGRGESS
ncbi:polymorphic toxin-type HINT domain-containing protein [Nonomuraea sp. NPDC005692]|uniref:polymorphic toxin-type HINT domain-containing protein n=1 Tax=Nonomuraea sp. NPDC005692 TaxID=3157168 RepID=UPI0033FD9D0E